MIKRNIFLFSVLLFFRPMFPDNTQTLSFFPIAKYQVNDIKIDDINSLDLTYWIKENPFTELEHGKSNIEINKEFIFLSGSKFIVINTMWSATYLEGSEEYIFDSSLLGVDGEYFYEVNNDGNIENNYFIIRIINNKLFVYDKITEKESIYICVNKAL
ncbi:hypothetical protein [Treponema sp. Marseille-Q4132]|uniref:hypothetical protein n=1 Tax=Treponema sp. Marseille-Q4132 TaxID=2766701 RepID=UPI001652F40F|nr:hypothetical protein [Treponema sp. Marseille-Q4132]QNL98197.1 hypothetical protein H9I35_05515 [Treponema sp. Marseille-Q4132]